MLFRLVQGIEVREKLLFVWCDQIFVESFVHIFENDGNPKVPARVFLAMKAGCFCLDADDITFFPGFFQQRIMIGLPELDKFVGISLFYAIVGLYESLAPHFIVFYPTFRVT